MLLHTNPTARARGVPRNPRCAWEDMWDLRARYTPDYKWRATANPRRSGSSSKPGAPAGSRRCSRNVSVHSPHRIARPRRFARNGGLSVEAHSMSTTRKALRPSSTTYARHKTMQINLNPTSERGASRDAVNRPRETFGDSHLISSDPRSRFGLVCDLFCCRGNRAGRVRRPVGRPGTPPDGSRRFRRREALHTPRRSVGDAAWPHGGVRVSGGVGANRGSSPATRRR